MFTVVRDMNTEYIPVESMLTTATRTDITWKNAPTTSRLCGI